MMFRHAGGATAKWSAKQEVAPDTFTVLSSAAATPKTHF